MARFTIHDSLFTAFYNDNSLEFSFIKEAQPKHSGEASAKQIINLFPDPVKPNNSILYCSPLYSQQIRSWMFDVGRSKLVFFVSFFLFVRKPRLSRRSLWRSRINQLTTLFKNCSGSHTPFARSFGVSTRRLPAAARRRTIVHRGRAVRQ